MRKPIIGVFALQGCVTPHRYHIEALDAEYREVRTAKELSNIDGLILPGGESTTMLKLIKEFNLEKELCATFQRVPVWGICAGAILMAQSVKSPEQRSFGLLDIVIQRNGYGNQLHSFNAIIENSTVSFIRAPIIEGIGDKVQIKAMFQDMPVWVQQENYIATTFHPELATDNPSNLHRFFIKIVNKSI